MSNVKVQKLFVQWLGSLKKCFTFNKCRYVFFPSDDFFFIKKYLNSIFQVRKLSNCLSHPMHFFHTDYVLLKKFNFVLYVDISYWQLQVGPDLPRPEEPQRILIHWPGSWGCSQSCRKIIWEGESELLILSEGQYHIFSRPDTFAIEKRLWLMVSFISAVHSKCQVRENEIISQRSVSRQSTKSFYIIFSYSHFIFQKSSPSSWHPSSAQHPALKTCSCKCILYLIWEPINIKLLIPVQYLQ